MFFELLISKIIGVENTWNFRVKRYFNDSSKTKDFKKKKTKVCFFEKGKSYCWFLIIEIFACEDMFEILNKFN